MSAEQAAARGDTVAARVHDFTHTEALSRGAMQALDKACAAFARGASAGLSADLRARVHLVLASLTQVTYDQYAQAAPEPTIAVVFKLPPLPGRGLLQLDPALGLHIIDQLLGGRGEGIAGGRALTVVEEALLETPVARLLQELARACEHLARFQAETITVADSLRALEVAKPMEAMTAAAFEMQVAAITGALTICLPAMLLKVDGAGASSAGLPTDQASLKAKLGASLQPLPVTCVVRLGRTRLSATELAELSEGDVLPLDTAANGEMDMLVAGRLKFRCGPTRCGSRMGVSIVGRV